MPQASPATMRVADPERAARDEHRRDRAAADVQPALDDRPGGLGLRVRRAARARRRRRAGSSRAGRRGPRRSWPRRRRTASSRPTPRAGGRASTSSCRTRCRVGVGPVDLVHGDDDRHLGGARVVDRLDGLRHDAVVGGHDQHGDVRHLRAAGAEGGERLVARRVEERDPAAVVVDLVGADVLRDAAGLGLDDCASRGWRRGASSCRGRRGP